MGLPGFEPDKSENETLIKYIVVFGRPGSNLPPICGEAFCIKSGTARIRTGVLRSRTAKDTKLPHSPEV